MSKTKQITIVGGGLAGLSLGIGLRKQNIPVRLLEAGTYPRHRVCGEFICGVSSSTLENLGITGAFDAKVMNHDSQWFHGAKSVLRRKLPTAAIGISRHHLDHWLAERFVELGGELETRARVNDKDLEEEATVWSCGRQRAQGGKWIGLKCHARKFCDSMTTDLEMHFGKRCYVGISKVEDDTANVCGLFEVDRQIKVADRSQLLLAYLRNCGLDQLADRLDASELLPESLLGVSAFELGHQPPPSSDTRLNIGDTHSMIPPFTGNGMTMAFQSAEIALNPLHDYANKKHDWRATVSKIRQQQSAQFDRRVRWAMRLHPFLLTPSGQRIFVTLAKLKALPFDAFFKRTRS